MASDQPVGNSKTATPQRDFEASYVAWAMASQLTITLIVLVSFIALPVITRYYKEFNIDFPYIAQLLMLRWGYHRIVLVAILASSIIAAMAPLRNRAVASTVTRFTFGTYLVITVLAVVSCLMPAMSIINTLTQ